MQESYKQHQVYNKLVRDKTLERITLDGRTYTARTLAPEEIPGALKTKLLEEAKEIQNARTPEELLKEIADMYEVLDALVKTHNIDRGTLEKVREEKAEKRGLFEQGVFLESAEPMDR
jgi:predicted house-cleaning noncanonical NTP pyrophosphatase (MazG superfamily)